MALAAATGGVVTMIARAFIDRKKIVEEVGTAAAQRIDSEIAILTKLTEENRVRLTSMYETQIQGFEKRILEKDAECEKKINKQAKEISVLNGKYNELKLKYNELLQKMIKETKK